MVFALIGVFFSRCKIYDESNEGSFIGNSITNMSISNNAVSNHNNNGHNNNMNGGKLKLLVQKPCFKIIVGLLSLGGIIAYSIFANMCYYKLNCEEIHPYIVFIPVSLFLTYVKFLWKISGSEILKNKNKLWQYRLLLFFRSLHSWYWETYQISSDPGIPHSFHGLVK